MEDELFCICGHPIKVMRDQGDAACRKDGIRFIDNLEEDRGSHYFRCPTCLKWIDEDKLIPF